MDRWVSKENFGCGFFYGTSILPVSQYSTASFDFPNCAGEGIFQNDSF